MLGKDHGAHVPPSSNDETYHSTAHLLALADSAFSSGDLAQATHLYLAAFDASTVIGSGAYQPAVDGLHKAWDAACALKDRALAEHIFEKLEPFSTSEEIAEHAEALQRLALDKLEEFGFTREDLQDMADMVSEDFAGALRDGQSPESVFAQVFSVDKPEAPAIRGVLSFPHAPKAPAAEKTELSAGEAKNPDEYTYHDLVGFDRAIADMNKLGIGLSHDKQFEEFMAVLARRHGISSLPAFETMVFTSPSREDAHQFMLATVQELSLPAVRMFMEETPMGYPVLCVVATSDFKMNPVRGGFSGPGVLILEDVDMWGAPFSSVEDDMEGLPAYAQMSRGARESIMFIRSCVENPDVQVMASCSSEERLDDFFADLLDPVSYCDVALPDAAERASIWRDICGQYPSLKLLMDDEVVRLSANLSRFDLYIAAREAVDQAFRSSVETRSFVPVTRDNLYNKIASFQPLDSEEYKELEDTAVEQLLLEIDHMDNSLKGLE